MSEKPTSGFGLAAIASKSRYGIVCAEPYPPWRAWTTSTSGSAKSAFRSAARCWASPGDVVVAFVDAVGELDAVALRLPPLDPAQDLGARVVRAGGSGDADRPSGRQRLHARRFSTRKVARARPRERLNAAAAAAPSARSGARAPGGSARGGGEGSLEPRARLARARLAAERGELAPEVGAWIGVGHRAPAGAARPPAAAAALDPEGLVRQVGAEPVDAHAREVALGVGGILERALEVLDVVGRLLMRVARGVDRVQPVEAAAESRETLAGVASERSPAAQTPCFASSRTRGAKSMRGSSSSSRPQSSVSFAR